MGMGVGDGGWGWGEGEGLFILLPPSGQRKVKQKLDNAMHEWERDA